MGIFKKLSSSKTAVTAPQTYRHNPFDRLDNYVPLATVQNSLYRELREAVPVLDAAIYKIVRLTGGFHIECSKNSHTLALQSFLKNVSVGGNQQGIEAFVATYLEQLLTYGTAVGEIVTDSHGRFAALYNADLEDIELRRGDDGISAVVCVKNFYETTPVEYPELVALSVLNPEAGQLCGNSIMKGLPFVSNILMKIYNTIGINWERVGNVRFAVTYKPQNDAVDKAYAKERALQVASEWSRAMESSGSVKDFVAVGDVSIKAIGADNQILDSAVPVRQMLEQIVAKLGIPPFLLGLNWSTTERMSYQQADVLTSEIDAYRRELNPTIAKICSLWLRMNGYDCDFQIEWNSITLQDITELSQSRLHDAQTKKILSEIGGEENDNQ